MSKSLAFETMTIETLLKTNQHRDFAMPSKEWSFYQEWNNTLFLHWRTTKSELSQLVPPELELDLFEGYPYISLVAFTMERIRPRMLPSFSPISTFHEINLRTYVRFQGKSGVYFINIEGSKAVSCWLARFISELPYKPCEMRRENGYFESRNIAQKNAACLRFVVEEKELIKSKLDNWLTERYALFQDGKKGINAFDIHHIAWPLYPLDLKEISLNYSKFGHLISEQPLLAHYSPGVQVLAWNKECYPR